MLRIAAALLSCTTKTTATRRRSAARLTNCAPRARSAPSTPAGEGGEGCG